MQVQINTDHNIEGREALASHVNNVVEGAMSRFNDQVTRVEVHLTDENSHKNSKNDMRCVMEARLQGHQPVAVTQHAATLHQAIDGAATKLVSLVDSTLGRLRDKRRGAIAPTPATPELKED